MILLLRHQQGETNVLNKYGMKRSKQLAVALKNYFDTDFKIYTCFPELNGKHIRPLQTSTIIGTELNISVHFFDQENIPDIKHNNVIIWHHGDMNTIIQHYYPKISYYWNPYEYDSCILLSQKDIQVDHDFIDKYRKSVFCF